MFYDSESNARNAKHVSLPEVQTVVLVSRDTETGPVGTAGTFHI